MRTRSALPAGVGRRPRRRRDARAAEQRDVRVARRSLRPGAGGRLRRARAQPRRLRPRVIGARPARPRARPGPRTTGAASPGRRSTRRQARRGASAACSTLDAARRRLHAVARRRRHAATRPRPLIELEQGPRTPSIMPTGDVRRPRRCTRRSTPRGDLWSRSPASTRSCAAHRRRRPRRSARASSCIPGGRHTRRPARAAPLEPSDVAVDHRGVVWTTLAARQRHRADRPRRRRDGTTAGGRVYPLPACGEDECPAVFPPDPAERPTRAAAADRVTQDARGQHARLVHRGQRRTASACCASRPTARELGQTHFSCGCQAPLGIALDQAGDVWFTEGVDNRIGRLTPDVTEPVRRRRRATLRHYRIPSAVLGRRAGAVAGPGAHLHPAQPRDRPPRARVVHRERDGQARLPRPGRSRAPGTTAGIGGDRRCRDTDFGTAPTPADLTIDRAGHGVLGRRVRRLRRHRRDRRAPARTGARAAAARPAPRRSLTDSPLVDPGGRPVVPRDGRQPHHPRSRRQRRQPAVPPRAAGRGRPRPPTRCSLAGSTRRPRSTCACCATAARRARASGVAVPRGRRADRGLGRGRRAAPRRRRRACSRTARDLQAAFAARCPPRGARRPTAGVDGTALPRRRGRRPARSPPTAAAGRGRRADGSLPPGRGAAAAVRWIAATPGARWEIRRGRRAGPTAGAAATPATPATPARPPHRRQRPSPRPPRRRRRRGRPTPRVADPPSACTGWTGARPSCGLTPRRRLQACLGRPGARRGAVAPLRGRRRRSASRAGRVASRRAGVEPLVQRPRRPAGRRAGAHGPGRAARRRARPARRTGARSSRSRAGRVADVRRRDPGAACGGSRSATSRARRSTARAARCSAGGLMRRRPAALVARWRRARRCARRRARRRGPPPGGRRCRGPGGSRAAATRAHRTRRRPRAPAAAARSARR